MRTWCYRVNIVKYIFRHRFLAVQAPSVKRHKIEKSRLSITSMFFHDSLAFLVFWVKSFILILLRKKTILILEHRRISRKIFNRFADPYIGITENKLRNDNVPFIRVGTSNNGFRDYWNFRFNELFLPYTLIYFFTYVYSIFIKKK